MLKDVGMTMLKRQEQDAVYAGQTSDDGSMKAKGHATIITCVTPFTAFESVIVSRNTRRPCYVSKRAYSCRVREF